MVTTLIFTTPFVREVTTLHFAYAVMYTHRLQNPQNPPATTKIFGVEALLPLSSMLICLIMLIVAKILWRLIKGVIMYYTVDFKKLGRASKEAWRRVIYPHHKCSFGGILPFENAIRDKYPNCVLRVRGVK